jgi:integrase/recombinase XerD
VSAYLGRYRGASRLHTESDLRIFLTWCVSQGLDPLATVRADIERYVRWLQDVRCYQPSTVSRRLSVVVGFYRVCVIDQVLPYSPADYVRRPVVPPESPTLGLGHLQFEAPITTARRSANPNDFALIAMLGLLGLRIFEACGANIGDLGEEHGHRVLRVRGKGGKVVRVPLPPAVARAIDQAVDGRNGGPILCNTHGFRMDPHAATRRLKHLAEAAGIRMPRMHPHMLRTPSSRPCSTPASACVTFRSPPATPTHAPPCATTAPAGTSTDTPTTYSPTTWPPAGGVASNMTGLAGKLDRCASAGRPGGNSPRVRRSPGSGSRLR